MQKNKQTKNHGVHFVLANCSLAQNFRWSVVDKLKLIFFLSQQESITNSF